MTDQPKLADDILRGCEQIAAFVGLDERRVFALLQQKKLPATKEGRVWVTTRSALKAHYDVAPKHQATNSEMTT